MSNFEGNVKKSSTSFKPQTRASDGAGVGRVVAGVFAGQDAPVVFEKADSPILPTDPAPNAGHRGERELGVNVDRVDRDGGAVYLASKISRVYRQIVSDGADLEILSREQRQRLADELIQHVYDGDHQHPSGEAGSTSQENTLAYIRGVAALLFGLVDEIPGTPEFLTRMAKSANHVEVECPHCHGANNVERSSFGGLQKITCGSCGKGWQQDVSISTFTKSDKPDLAALRKQLLTLTENIRRILAERAGRLAESSASNGSRFVHKSTAEKELHKALENGVSVPFSGADPRTAAEKASGGRKFQTRA